MPAGRANLQALATLAEAYRVLAPGGVLVVADSIQLGDRPAAERTYREYVRRVPKEGLRRRRRVPCERMRHFLAQEAEELTGVLSPLPPPAAACRA